MKKVCILLVLAICSYANAVPALFDVRFENDTVGQAPSVSPAATVAGAVNNQPTGVVTGGSDTILVQYAYADTITGNHLGSGNAVVISSANDGNTPQLQFYGDPNNSITKGEKGPVIIRCDLLLDSASSSGSFYEELLDQSGTTAMKLTFNLASGSITATDYNSTIPTNVTISGFSRGIQGEIVLVLDRQYWTCDLFINGLKCGQLNINPALSAVNNLKYSASAAAAGTIVLDNIGIMLSPMRCADNQYFRIDYLSSDIDKDCTVYLGDMSMLTSDWLINSQ